MRSKKGRLDIVKEPGSEIEYMGAINFEIQDGDINDYIDAMKRGSAILRAKSKMIVNTLGERRINYLYPVSVAAK